MVGGTTFRRRVIHGEIPESWSFNLSGEKAVLTHRPGYFCLDNAFALIEGHPLGVKMRFRFATCPALAPMRSDLWLVVALERRHGLML